MDEDLSKEKLRKNAVHVGGIAALRKMRKLVLYYFYIDRPDVQVLTFADRATLVTPS